MNTIRTLNIGIMSLKAYQKRTLDIVGGKRKPARNEPKLWFPSLKALGEVLNDRNKALLATIRREQPDSITALAQLTDRKVANLSRTLRTLEGYGIVALEAVDGGRTLRPRVKADRIRIVADL
jgi:predicted transcriptional regulator